MRKLSSVSLSLHSKIRLLLQVVAVAAVLTATAAAQGASSSHAQLNQLVEQNAAHWQQVSKQIWDYAELGYHETKSSELLQEQLKAAGFRVQAGVADEPTAFIASYGEGKPVVAILGEFDALPGLSQQTVPTRDPVKAGAPGHGCGHNLLGAGAALAAVSLKQYMESHHAPGTLRYYGTPAEEGGSGKVYMVREGAFKDVDVVLHWHPADRNSVANGGALAVVSAKFTFHGVAAHAAMAPDRGRSALDAVMLMGNGIEFLREHVPSNTRIHYIISKGGVAPNIVPDLAQMDLMARSPSNATLKEVWDRIQKIAQGAALMTGTTLEMKDIGSDANIIPNDALAAVAQKNLTWRKWAASRWTPTKGSLRSNYRRPLGWRLRRYMGGGHRGPHVAGSRYVRHGHRATGHGDCGEGDRSHRDRSVHRPGARAVG